MYKQNGKISILVNFKEIGRVYLASLGIFLDL